MAQERGAYMTSHRVRHRVLTATLRTRRSERTVRKELRPLPIVAPQTLNTGLAIPDCVRLQLIWFKTTSPPLELRELLFVSLFPNFFAANSVKETNLAQTVVWPVIFKQKNKSKQIKKWRWCQNTLFKETLNIFVLVKLGFIFFYIVSDLVNISRFIQQSFLPIPSLWPTCYVP